VEVIHHGGKDTVTGSCHELRFGRQSILLDCGMFQGQNSRPLEVKFPVKHIQALVVTHAHIDHIGRIPWLLAAGFKGLIYCTPATAELLPLMLEDGLKLQLGLNKGQRHRVLEFVRKRIRAVDYHQWLPIKLKQETVYLRFNPAGHILGSAYVEFKQADGRVTVFSGDLGPRNTPLLPDPVAPRRADTLFIESTYGNKTHQIVAERSERLFDIIQRSLQDGGAIIIPAFSVGRTQELLFDIEQLIHNHQITAKLPVILDSPMAAKVTRSYRRFKKLWGKEAKQRLDAHRHPLAFEQCVTVVDHPSHKALVNRLTTTGESAIVVAASGMCQGGRVMAYLKALLPDKRTDVIFSGYQAQGTLGHMLQQGCKQIEVDGQLIQVEAQLHTMSGYSAHADQQDLIEFVEAIEQRPESIHLIHGEAEVKRAFATMLEQRGYLVRC